jgi:hypothetical protein
MNGSIMKIAGEEALRQNIAKTKEYVQQHGGGGHTIITASSLPMAGQPNLQFEGVHVENVGQAGQGKTVIKPQFHVCATEAEWNQMTDAEKNDPLIYWVRPWASSFALDSDRTPVGTVVSIGCNLTTIDPEDTLISFPNKDYLICKGTVCYINSYPQLANYIESAYGSKNYFGGDGTSTFAVPDWSADFPENGILCIKAQISSTAITFAEVDDTGIYAGEDKVPSCARVAGISLDVKRITYVHDNVSVPANGVYGVTSGWIKQGTDDLTGYTIVGADYYSTGVDGVFIRTINISSSPQMYIDNPTSSAITASPAIKIVYVKINA